jgi:hypothetical protein
MSSRTRLSDVVGRAGHARAPATTRLLHAPAPVERQRLCGEPVTGIGISNALPRPGRGCKRHGRGAARGERAHSGASGCEPCRAASSRGFSNAAAVILAHNHPSGMPDPSAADRMLTDALKRALGTVNVSVLDHLIIAGQKTCSLAEHGQIQEWEPCASWPPVRPRSSAAFPLGLRSGVIRLGWSSCSDWRRWRRDRGCTFRSHSVRAPNARLRSRVVPQGPEVAGPAGRQVVGRQVVHDSRLAAAVGTRDGDQLGTVGEPFEIQRDLIQAQTIADSAEALEVQASAVARDVPMEKTRPVAPVAVRCQPTGLGKPLQATGSTGRAACIGAQY